MIVDLMLLYSCDGPFGCRGLPLIYDCGFNVAVFLFLLILVPMVSLIYDCGFSVAVFLCLLILVPRVAFNL